MKEKILAAYEKLAVPYDQKIDTKPHNAFYDRPNTLRLLGDVQGKKILDAACGPGKYAEILMSLGAEVTGYDLSPTMIQLAKIRNEGKGHFFVHDLGAEVPMLSNESFHSVLCALALHYIEDWTTTLEEFYRVLKENGELVISIEHPFFDWQYFKSEDYFNVEQVQATWSGFGEPVVVRCNRRPLQDCINPIINAGFRITEILEPKPTEEFLNYDPKHYKELMEFPAFIHIKASKS